MDNNDLYYINRSKVQFKIHAKVYHIKTNTESMANYNREDTNKAAKVLISKVYTHKSNEKVEDILDDIHFRTKNDVYQNMGFLEYLVTSTPSEEKQKWEDFYDKQLELNNKVIGQVEDLVIMLDKKKETNKKKLMDVLATL